VAPPPTTKGAREGFWGAECHKYLYKTLDQYSVQDPPQRYKNGENSGMTAGSDQVLQKLFLFHRAKSSYHSSSANLIVQPKQLYLYNPVRECSIPSLCCGPEQFRRILPFKIDVSAVAQNTFAAFPPPKSVSSLWLGNISPHTPLQKQRLCCGPKSFHRILPSKIKVSTVPRINFTAFFQHLRASMFLQNRAPVVPEMQVLMECQILHLPCTLLFYSDAL
jgi:hypothetical protein